MAGARGSACIHQLPLQHKDFDQPQQVVLSQCRTAFVTAWWDSDAGSRCRSNRCLQSVSSPDVRIIRALKI